MGSGSSGSVSMVAGWAMPSGGSRAVWVEIGWDEELLGAGGMCMGMISGSVYSSWGGLFGEK